MELIIKSPKHGEMVALLDDSDAELIKGYVWRPHKSKRTFYVTAVVPGSGRKNRKHVFMHNLIMGAIGVDHINHSGLDNRRSNLRLATQAQNTKNMSVKCTNRFGLKGVTFCKPKSAYASHITVDYKHIFLGYYSSLIDASNAYNEAAIKYFKEFANLNVISPEREIELRKLDLPTLKSRGKNKTKQRGVSFCKGVYMARKTVGGETHYIGSYQTEAEAATAYNNFVKN